MLSGCIIKVTQFWVTFVFLFLLIGCGDKDRNNHMQRRASLSINRHVKTVNPVRMTNAVRHKISAGHAKNGKISAQLLKKLLECAVDTDNRQALKILVEKYRRHPDPKQRMEFVEALMDFDQDGVPYLARFIRDINKEVSDRALTILESQIDLVEEPSVKSSVLCDAILSVDDADSLHILCSKLATLPPSVAVKQIATICKMASTHPEAAEAVKKEYEAITGEPFTTVADANRWARMHR